MWGQLVVGQLQLEASLVSATPGRLGVAVLGPLDAKFQHTAHKTTEHVKYDVFLPVSRDSRISRNIVLCIVLQNHLEGVYPECSGAKRLAFVEAN